MSKPQILVAEDERVVALDLKNRLKSMGYEVCAVVSTGEEAVDKARAARPEVILMDVMLHGEMDGISAAGVIRSEAPIPVIYVTSYVDDATLERAKMTEPFGYIIKPFEDRELDLNIRMALYKNSVERKLVENERRLSTTLTSIGDAVVTIGPEGRVQYLNPAAEQLLGCAGSQAVDRDFGEVMELYRDGEKVPPEVVRKCGSGDCDMFNSGGDLAVAASGGQHIPISGSVSPIVGPAEVYGRAGTSGSVVVLRDITQARLAEQALKDSVVQLRRTLDETVNVLTAVSEKRDPYTAGHQQRVGELAVAIAEEMGLPGEMTEGIRVAGALHDIGKIYVPAEILSKPSRLTSIEFGLVKSHSEVGHEILKGVTFPWPVADVVLQHHERMDGSGYPGGLKGEEIIPEARIVAVADVVEAMSSHRPYRAALGIEPALREVEKNRGKWYDPDAVDACLALFRQGFRFSKV